MNDVRIISLFFTLFLILPGLIILYFSIQKKAFFENEEWKKWSVPDATLLGIILGVINKATGPFGARVVLMLFSIAAICAGAYAIVSIER